MERTDDYDSVVVTVRLPRWLVRDMDKVARGQFDTRSDVIRRLLRTALKSRRAA